MMTLTIIFALMGAVIGCQVGYSVKVAKLERNGEYSYKRFWASIIIFFALAALFGEVKSSLPDNQSLLASLVPAIAFVISFIVAGRIAFIKSMRP